MFISVSHWSASRPSVATEAMDINTDPNWCRDTDADMALGSSSGPNIIKGPGGSAGHSRSAWHSCSMTLRHQHGLRRQNRPLASPWPLLVTGAKDQLRS